MPGPRATGPQVPLSPADARRLSEAFSLLQRGSGAHALSVATEVATRLPDSAEAQHMLALCRKESGDLAGAASAFETALRRTPADPHLLGNYANLLCQLSRFPEAIPLYRRALEIAPDHARTALNLGLALRNAGDPGGACAALEHAIRLNPSSSPAWQALGAARRSADDLEGAEDAVRRAVALDPNNGPAWTSLGVIRRLVGDPAEALACYTRARRAGFAGAEIDDAEASAFLDAGEPARAVEIARRLTVKAPDYIHGHTLLAHLLWEHGSLLAPGEDPLGAFRKAVESLSGNRPLRLAYLRFLLDAKAADEALLQVRALRASGDDPSLAGMEANALEMLGQTEAAAAIFSRVYPALRRDPGFLNLYVRHLLRTRQPEPAAARALEALEIEPDNQLALAWLGVAWRMLGDAREEWLCGYDRLVSEVEVEPPAEFGDTPDFLRALETTLAALHTAQREPVNQSLLGGSQTSGMLFGRREPAIAALRRAIAAAVSRHVAGLPDNAAHPFLRRKSAGIRFAGSWSVRLRSSGRHVNHFHQEGWISSAYYVSLPPSMSLAPAGDTSGCIQFGEPPAELELGLGPRRVVRPRAGGLVLFPSYIWHGTVPFRDETPRLTVAFDVQPSGTPRGA
jgi:tetratricopeptide (TPR) repeat protein